MSYLGKLYCSILYKRIKLEVDKNLVPKAQETLGIKIEQLTTFLHYLFY